MSHFHSIRRAWPQALLALLVLAADSPALASDGIAIPDPGGLTLLALGVLGVVIGRQSGKRPPRN